MIRNTTGLYPYQIGDAVGMLESLQAHGAALNAGETGTGKTYSIMAVAREVEIAPVVVCPRAVMPAWHAVAAFFGGTVHTINYERLTGSENEYGFLRNPPGIKEARKRVRELVAEIDAYRACEGLLLGTTSGTDLEVSLAKERFPHGWYHAKTSELIVAKDYIKNLNKLRVFTWDNEIPLIVFDEGHRCKGQKSLNGKALCAAVDQGIPVIIASATAASNPLEMYALGHALRLHNKTNFWSWAKSYGCEPLEHGGLVFRGGDPALKRLHATIYPSRGVRVLRDEIADFPESQITAELYHLPEADKIQALYDDLKTELADIESKRESDRDLEHVLTRLLRDRQQIEMLKVPLFVELAEDAIDEGMSVVIFVNFEASLNAICALLKTTVRVDGAQVGDAGAIIRQGNIDLFNSGQSRVIVCNIKAGGVGLNLHDLDGRFPRLTLVSPTYSAIDLIQTLGRVWRAGAKSKSLQRIVLVKDTVEEGIQKNLQGKLKNLSLINDGDVRTIIK